MSRGFNLFLRIISLYLKEEWARASSTHQAFIFAAFSKRDRLVGGVSGPSFFQQDLQKASGDLSRVIQESLASSDAKKTHAK